MTAINEEITRLCASNIELKQRNEQLELMLVYLESLKQDNEFLRKKLDCEK